MAQSGNKELADWEYAKVGIALWLNNQPDEAIEHLQSRIDSTQILAGYTFISCMNGVISYELEKIEDAQKMLRELEHRCAGDVGWLKSVRSIFFGSSEPTKSLATVLEEQIILADTQLCSAILTFLTQDLSGFMRGSWLLKKAWKVYQHTYNQIFNLYTKIVRDDETVTNHPPDFQFESNQNGQESGSIASLKSENSLSCDWTVPSSGATTPLDGDVLEWRIYSLTLVLILFSFISLVDILIDPENSNKPKSSTGIVQSVSEYFLGTKNLSNGKSTKMGNSQSHSMNLSNTCSSINGPIAVPSLPRSKSTDHHQNDTTTATNNPSKSRLHLSLNGNHLNRGERNGTQKPEIEPEVIKRLMGAISFGYGAFQLSVSLLPPNLLKLVSFFGFEGDRSTGLSCLKYSRTTDDMRSPLATLALLWYLTIGTQIFASDESNLDDEISEAAEILRQSEDMFSTSSLFLFFKGRVERMKSNMTTAIESFEHAYHVSAQPEIKLLCLHEVGWCHLIHLDYGNAMNDFHAVRQHSQFSKSFFIYLTAICQGAYGHFSDLILLKTELYMSITNSNQKESQIEKFLMRRFERMPNSVTEQAHMFQCVYWKYFVYEMLFLWNTLPSCNTQVLDEIMQDCGIEQSIINEPMKGIGKLILGYCHAHRKNFTEAIQAYRECIAVRENEPPTHAHISAFAHFGLANILIKQYEKREEGKQLLLMAQQKFKNYDFESRLGVRIHAALKKLH